MNCTSIIMWVIGLLILISLDACSAGRRRGKRTDVNFQSDTDVKNYLKNRDMDIFKCKKIVMINWLHSVVPYVDLECEVMGDVKSVEWYKNESLLDTGGSGRFISLSQPHYSKSTFFNTWHDYKLRMLHVTEADNGPYKLIISSPSGRVEHKNIILEVMTDYREEKWMDWMKKVGADRVKYQNERKAVKMRKRELMRQLRKRDKASRRKHSRLSKKLIFDR